MSELNPPEANSNLPPLAIRETGLPAGWQFAQIAPSYSPEPELEEVGIPLLHYLWIVRRQRYKIGAFVAVSLFGTYLVSSRLTPIFQATTMVDVDRQAPPGIVGQEAQRISVANDADQFLATQVKLIQSDAVLRPVAEKYALLERERQFSENISKESTANAPVLLKRLRVTRPPNTYLLLISYRSPDANLAADVANAI